MVMKLSVRILARFFGVTQACLLHTNTSNLYPVEVNSSKSRSVRCRQILLQADIAKRRTMESNPTVDESSILQNDRTPCSPISKTEDLQITLSLTTMDSSSL